ncbi:hypothetical protein DNTS_024321 [Danionella cerebrum]|uniref:Fibronectin type-III domain-containing protein n=1 Tax=Danionella cerebrum TaxID=2873325 RepID=A0A553NLK7_9TELE|nr:hypothetical protein DNTS_024321 [Danionella translucida]
MDTHNFKMWLMCVLGVLFISIGGFSQDIQKPDLREVFAAVGSPVNITCPHTDEEGVEWRLNNTVLVSRAVLNIQNASLKDRGIYSCHRTDGDIIQVVSLHLGCKSSSEPLSSARQCQQRIEHGSLCVLEELELFATEPTLFNITAVNALGCATRIWPFIFEEIVKPDPPVNISVMVMPDRKLSVQWDPPPTWPDPVNFLLKYRVKFHLGKPASSRTLGPYETNRMVLSGLVAGRIYHIQISAKDFLDVGQSSEWSTPITISLPIN